MIQKEIFGQGFEEKIILQNDGKGILLCNYRVEVTQSEYSIISLLLETADWTERAKISLLTGGKESSIPVHVANINKKASLASGRCLIEGKRSGEYRISKYL